METLDTRLTKLVNKSRIMLFMKGSPESPFCGFSKRMVAVLAKYDGVEYSHFDILQDDEVREGLKKKSKWPTYPQLYIDGELVGGIDIVEEMDGAKELEDILFI